MKFKFVIVASSWLFILLYQWCTVTQTSNLSANCQRLIRKGEWNDLPNTT